MCDFVDESLLQRGDNVGFILACSVVGALSTVSLVAGKHVVRLVAFVAASGSAAWAAYTWIALECDARLVLTAVAALVAGVAAVCLFRTALFVAGASASALVAHATYTLASGPMEYRWYAIVGGAAVGGVVTVLAPKNATRIVVSAALGATGITLVLAWTLLIAAEVQLPLVIGLTLVGSAIQYKVSRITLGKRKQVPVGVPVCEAVET